MVLLACLAQVAPAQEARPAAADQDRRVWAAVLTHTILPEARRLSRDPVPVPVLSRTVSVCEAAHDRTCILNSQVETFLEDRIGEPVVGPQPAAVIPDRSARAALVASLVERSRQRQVMDGLDATVVRMVPFEDEQNVMVRDRDVSRYAGMTLPGYAASEALVYGFYVCGARCGSGWLFLLDHATSEWRVRSRYPLWMR